MQGWKHAIQNVGFDANRSPELNNSPSFITVFLLAPLMLLHTFFAAIGSTQTLSIATGNPSGIYYPLGGGLASIWSRNLKGVNIKAEVTAGSVTNLIQVAKLESEVGLSQSDSVFDAVEGRGKFPRPLPLAVLGKLYPNVVHLVTIAGSGIETVRDLRGRKVSVGPPGSGNAVTAWNILQALGIAEDDFVVRQLNYTETSNGLKDGTIDAGFIAAGLGVAAVRELAIARDIELVPFTDDEINSIKTATPAYSGFSIPAGIYKGIGSPVQTPTMWNLLVVNQTMSSDLAYNLIKTVFDYRKYLLNISQVVKFITHETAIDVGFLPMHPGAERYYDEILAAKDKSD